MTDTRHKTTIEVGVEDRGEVAQLQQQIARTFDPKAIEAFQRGLDRATKSFEKMGAAAQKAGFTGGSFGGSPGFGGGGPAPGNSSQLGLGEISELRRAIADLAEQHKKQNEREDRRDRDKDAAARGGGFLAGAAGVAGAAGTMAAAAMSGGFVATVAQQTASLIPVIGDAIGQVIGAGAQQAIALYQEHAQQQMAQAAVFGQTGIGAGGFGEARAAGRAFGLQPGEMPGVLSSFSGTSGLDGSRLTSALPTQLALSRLLGVEGAGGLVGAGGTSGGVVADPSELMLQAVSEGLAAGIRTTRLDQYLQNVSGWVEGVRSQGIDLAPESALRMVAGMSSAGIRGEAAVATAQSMSNALAGAGRGRGIGHGLALRAVGFGVDPSLRYQDALERLEQRRPEDMQRFVEQARNMGGSTQDRAAFLRHMVESVGGSLNAVNSRMLIQNGFAGDLFGDTTGATAMIQGRAAEAGGIFAAGRTQAGLSEQRMAEGARVSGTAIGLLRRDVEMVARVLPSVARALDQFNERIGAVLAAGDSGGVGSAVVETARQAADLAVDVITGVLEAGARGAADALGVPLSPDGRTMQVTGADGQQHDAILPGMTGPQADASTAAGHLRRAADVLDRIGFPMDADLASAPA